MVDINQYYQSESDYLKASDIPAGQQYQLTISEISVTEFENDGKKVHKVTLAFSNAEKKLSLNKTNATTIAHVHGPETDNWIGKDILVYSTKVSYGDKMVDAVRVDMPRVTQAPPAPTPPAPTPPAAPEPPPFDDDMPF